MNKFAIALLGFMLVGVSSVFAGEDTDRICADETKIGLLHESPQISYPDAKVSIDTVWKKFNSASVMEWPADPNEYFSLYYVVNIQAVSVYGGNVRSELYVYNCKTKKAKQLASYSIDRNQEDHYRVDIVDNDTLIVVGRSSGITIWPTTTIVGFSLASNKEVFRYKNTKDLVPEGTIRWFASGKWAWYFYYDAPGYRKSAEIYKLDKRTKKMQKL